MDLIRKYFPHLTPKQVEQFEAMGPLYAEWNERINVISRKDIDNVYKHHILHSLAIACFFTPEPGTTFMDLGTGGGFPAIPLAVMWPECHFHLVDRIAKKLKVAQAVAEAIGLQNVTFQHGDSAECKEKFDFVVSRAVMDLGDLIKAASRNISPRSANHLPNGLLCLKGGDLAAEVTAARRPVVEVPVTDWFDDPFFINKELIYVKLGK